MSQPSAHSVLPNRAAMAEELRRLLPKIQGFHKAKPLPFGVPAIDHCLPQGGLPGGALHEIVPAGGSASAAFGFMVALLARISSPPPCGEGLRVGVRRFGKNVDVNASPLDPPPNPPPQGGREQTNRRPIVFVLPSYGLRHNGRPYGPGIRALGLDPNRLILVGTAHRKQTLWALEEALHARAVAAVAGVIDKLDLKSSLRLQLAASDAGVPLLLLRPAEILEASAAATRWRIAAAAAVRDRFGLIAQARWQLMLERCRNGRAGEWIVEYDHVTHCFSLAAALADPADAGGASEKSFQRAG
jgi:protein ImuA